MIKDINTDNLKITIVLRNGEVFKGHDITSNPAGTTEKCVSCWVGDSVRVFPIDTVQYFDLFDGSSDLDKPQIK